MGLADRIVSEAEHSRRLKELLEGLEEYVMDSIVSLTADPTLLALIDLTIKTEERGFLCPNPLDEPYFYSNYIRKWILNGIHEYREIKSSQESFKEGFLKSTK